MEITLARNSKNPKRRQRALYLQAGIWLANTETYLRYIAPERQGITDPFYLGDSLSFYKMVIPGLNQGLRYVKQILADIILKTAGEINVAKIKLDGDSGYFKIIICKNREILEPIVLSQNRVVDCAETLHGYLEMERLLREEIERRIKWSIDRQ